MEETDKNCNNDLYHKFTFASHSIKVLLYCFLSSNSRTSIKLNDLLPNVQSEKKYSFTLGRDHHRLKASKPRPPNSKKYLPCFTCSNKRSRN